MLKHKDTKTRRDREADNLLLSALVSLCFKPFLRIKKVIKWAK